MDSNTLHVISVSGGKDSTVLLLLALSRVPRERLRVVFCDTGNEHPQTYAYLTYLEQTLGLEIVRLKADFSAEMAAKRRFIANDQRTGRDAKGRRRRWSNRAKRRALAHLYPTGNPFLDLCLIKGRFPSNRAQFCTHELKRNQAVSYQLDLVDQGYRVVSWQGIRRDESARRRNAERIEWIGPRMIAYRPLVDWTAEQVFAYHRQQHIEPNPLYRQGMHRVGCMPCVNVAKGELHEISRRFPEQIQRISDWEQRVCCTSKRGFSTFLHKGPGEHGSATAQQIFAAANIWQTVQWSKTTHGGRQFDLLAESNDVHVCASEYGLCE